MTDNYAILESFNLLEPVTMFENIDPFEYFNEDGVAFLEDAIMEASDGAKKKNIFKKLWDLIKKIFKWIQKQVLKFINWIKGFFKKKKKSADQCIENVLHVESVQYESLHIPHKVKHVAAQAYETVESIIGSGIKIKLPKHPSSTVEIPDDVTVYSKKMIARFDSTSSSVSFTLEDVYNRSVYSDSFRSNEQFQRMKHGKVTGHKVVDVRHIIGTVTMIKNPKILDSMVEISKIAADREFDGIDFEHMVDKFTESYHKAAKPMLGLIDNHSTSDAFRGYTLSLDELTEFNKKVTDINKYLTVIDLPEPVDTDVKTTGNQDSYEVTNALNSLASICCEIQMGFNAITATIQQVYTIDRKYCGSINDTEKLSIFVKNMIEANLPPKYISYNAYLASTNELNGNGDKDHPIWGQSRVVFFPLDKKNVVHKIALSQWGVRANMSEVSTSKKFNEEGAGNFIALVTWSSSNAHVIDTERLNTEDPLCKDRKAVSDLKGDIAEFTHNNNIPLAITLDVAAGHNVGVKPNGKLSIIDYGLAYRKDPTKLSFM